MRNVIMVDLETLSTSARAVVLAIGVAGFDKNGEDYSYYSRLDIGRQQILGRKIDESTLEWWMGQDDNARKLFKEDKVETMGALVDLFTELEDKFDLKVMTVLGNGANFDITIIEDLCETFGVRVPWKYRNIACYRTLKELTKSIPSCKFVREGVHHNALSDAKSQLAHFVKIMDELTKRIV